MKKQLALVFCAAILISCGDKKKEEAPKEVVSYELEAKPPVELGEQIFAGKGNCVACHKPNEKVIGPSLQDIAKIYKEQNGDMVNFLKGNGKPLVDPSQYEVMKANFAITKTMSDEELKGLEAYVYSFLK